MTGAFKLPENLGLATDLLLHAEIGVVEQSEPYIVARTPDAPEYFFGNMLVLPARPANSDVAQLEEDFARLVGAPPRILHRTFVWAEQGDDPVDLTAFVQHGYDATVCRVLVAQPEDLRRVSTNAAVAVRPLNSNEDWDAWATMLLADMDDPSDVTSIRYVAWQQAAYRTLVSRGLGDEWGAFIDGELAGSLGLFFIGGIGRFQSVLTGEPYRNRGVCKTLVSEAIARTAGRANRLVMVADESHHAGTIYETLGFRRRDRMGRACREPQ
ncbi:GNAT family N-acetyltransferase [Paraburkholderia sp.]|uniref:GNAT family N-acetyltransferase n=1 Tax=Paraburkholderia sp. TaxID=1926495 RepID=UPI003D6FEA75